MGKLKNPLVSIVTPSYNQGQFLEKTILSVLDQDYPDLEYYVIDGGSTDRSVEIIKKYQDRLAGWVSETDQGQTDAINKGFSLCRGEIMAWLNSDDIYYPGAVRSAVDKLLADPSAGMVYGDTNLIDKDDNVVGKFNAQQTNYRRLMQGGVYIPQPAAFWRRGLWDQVGPLDPSFYFAMDYDLWVKFSKVSRIIYTPRLWAGFRIHGAGKTLLADARCWPEMKQIYHREGGGFLSIFMGKYLLRMMLGPLWGWFKRKRLGL
jgi:glycosyltransferase involved in cell wall biosynthesis